MSKKYDFNSILMKVGIPVSYTHLDVYKRQEQYVSRNMSQIRGKTSWGKVIINFKYNILFVLKCIIFQGNYF